jgi:hypothetical protein
LISEIPSPEVLRIAVEKIELDTDLDDARFRLPR